MRNLPSHEYEVELLHMRFAFTQCAWLGIALATVALSPISNHTITQNVVASTSPSGVNVFLNYTPAQGETKSLTQLCWSGDRGLSAKTFRFTSLTATDGAGNAVAIHPVLGDANMAAWRQTVGEATQIGETMALSVALGADTESALTTITTLYGTLELKLGKNVIRITPESRQRMQIAHSSALEAKGFKLTEVGDQEKLNLQFSYTNEKKGTLPNIFLVDAAGKPFYSSKPRMDGFGLVKISSTDSIPPDTKIRVGTSVDQKNLIPNAMQLFQSKELLAAALSKRGLRLNEFSRNTSTVFTVELIRAPSTTLAPEVELDFAGKRIKGQSIAPSSQPNPGTSNTTTWVFDIPTEFAGKRPDILVLLPGDEGPRLVQFQFNNPFGPQTKPL